MTALILSEKTAIGEALWKVAVMYVKGALTNDEVRAIAGGDMQCGVGTRGGCDEAVLRIQNALDGDTRNIAILADISNAFNTRERADMIFRT